MRTGITVVWMGDPHTYAESVQEKVWGELSSRPEWQAWLGEHIFGASGSASSSTRTGTTTGSSSAATPCATSSRSTTSLAAFEKHYLPDFMAHLFREVYLAWAHKLDLPEPPDVADPPH